MRVLILASGKGSNARAVMQAVKDGKVYDLPYEQFGMSATFAYQDALETLKKLLYTES
mgnify:CR=1 FL=1